MAGNTVVRGMTEAESADLVAAAAAEGWNPGLADAAIFRAADPDAWIAATSDGVLVGGGVITSYGGVYGFMGLFIVRPEFRGRGHGDRLWHARLERLVARLRPGAPIGMDGVFAMQAWYAKGGFVLAHRNLRFRGDVPESARAAAGNSAHPAAARGPASGADLRDARDVPFDALRAYDRTCFPGPRDTFLTLWLAQPAARTVVALRGGGVVGYGTIRRCVAGAKVGPLFADDAAVAEDLFAALLPFASGGPVFLDVPEPNAAALALVRRHGMTEVFGCARMYRGPRPDVREERVFGVTTFELG